MSVDVCNSCAKCPSRFLCWVDIDDESIQDLGVGTVSSRIKVSRGETLIHHGQVFDNVYAVRSGSFKTVTKASDGRERVTGFNLSGEWIGLDGLMSKRHLARREAIEDSEVCVVSLVRLESAAKDYPTLQQNLLLRMSQEAVCEGDGEVLTMHGSTQEKVASLLLDLIERRQERGFAPSELILKMSHRDLASYLCVTPDALNRAFTRLIDGEILEIQKQHVRIHDMAKLQAVAQPKARWSVMGLNSTPWAAAISDTEGNRRRATCVMAQQRSQSF